MRILQSTGTFLSFIVVPLFYRCTSQTDSAYRTHHKIHTNNTEMLNYELCDKYNREGQLCGKCKEGFGPPVYSYTFSCVKCREADFKLNLLKYIAAAFVPLTVFFFLIVVFKVPVTSGPMVVYVLHDQSIAINTFTSFPVLCNALATINIQDYHTVFRHMELGYPPLDIQTILYPPVYDYTASSGFGLSNRCLPSPPDSSDLHLCVSSR